MSIDDLIKWGYFNKIRVLNYKSRNQYKIVIARCPIM